MSLQIILPVGMLLIYGQGTEQSQTGIVPTNTNIKFGTVYQIWAGGESWIYAGVTSIMFKENDVVCRLAVTENNPNDVYTMLPARLVTKENILL